MSAHGIIMKQYFKYVIFFLVILSVRLQKSVVSLCCSKSRTEKVVFQSSLSVFEPSVGSTKQDICHSNPTMGTAPAGPGQMPLTNITVHYINSPGEAVSGT